MSDVSEQTLRRASEMFHVVSAFSSEDLLPGCRNAAVAKTLKDNLRTRDEIRRIAADGFELCVRALASADAQGVTIHECGTLGEDPWDGNAR